MSPGKGRRGFLAGSLLLPSFEASPLILHGLLKRATGRFRPTPEALNAACHISPPLCQEGTFAIEEKRTLAYVCGVWRGRQDVNGRYRAGSFLSFFSRMLWNDQRGPHGRSVYRFFLALGVPLVFGASIGAAFRGRSGRGLGLVTLAFGLAGLLCGGLAFTICRDGYGLFAWVLLMAGGVACFGGGCWLRVGRGRIWGSLRGT